MDLESLNFYRNNVDYTFNSGKAGRNTIVYNSKYPYVDSVKTNHGLQYYGTPGELSAQYKTSKDISVMSAPPQGRNYYTSYPPNPRISNSSPFPPNNNNQKGISSASPYHIIKLNFAGRDSLGLDLKNTSRKYSSWY